MLSLLIFNLGNLPVFAVESRSFTQTVAQAIPAVTINRPILKTGSEGSLVSELQAVLKLLGYYTGVVNGVYGDSTAIAVSQFQSAAGVSADGIAGPATWERLFPDTLSSSTAYVPIPSNNSVSVRKAPSRPSLSNPQAAASRPYTTFSNDSASPNSTSSNSASAFPVPSTLQTTASVLNSPTPPNNQRVPLETSSQSMAVTLPILREGMEGSAVKQLQERLKTLGFLQGSVDGVFGLSTQAAVKAAQQKFQLEPDGIVGPATWSVLLR